MPVTLATKCGSNRLAYGTTPFEEFSDAFATSAPLFPIAHPHSTPQPVIQFRNGRVILAQSVVTHPSSHILREFVHSVIHRYSPASSGESTNPPLELLER